MHLYEHKKYVFRSVKLCGKILSGSKKPAKKIQSWTKSDVQYVGYDCARFFLRITLFGS